MTLKSDPLSTIQPFWHIDCPVCGGDDFTEAGVGGGIWCDECNTQFKVRMTSGDPGCVVDALFDDTCNIMKGDGTKRAWLKALSEMGCYTKPDWPKGMKPKVYAYRIMKEPDNGTYCTDDRGWILALSGFTPDKDVPPILRDPRGTLAIKHLTGPLVSREVALEWGQQID